MNAAARTNWNAIKYPICALVLLVSVASVLGAEPLEFVQAIKDGVDGISIKNHVGAVTARGDYVYASIVYSGQIKCFKRDLTTGKLAYIDEWKADDKGMCMNGLVWAGNRLYANCGCGHWTGDQDSRGLRWLEMDEKTGKLTEKGKIDIPISSGLLASPDQKHLYLLLRQKRTVVHYTLAADGTPQKAGEAVFKDAATDVFRIALTPDGKALYGMYGDQTFALGCMEIGADGSPVYKKAFGLEKLTEGIEWPKGKWGYGWGRGFGITPDGQQVYADFCNYFKDHRIAVYARDPKTNELAFVKRTEDVSGPVMTKICTWAFTADGTGGYFASEGETTGNVVGWFSRDPKSGELKLGGKVKETGGSGPDSLFYDAEHGFVYVGTWRSQQLFVMRVKKGASQTAGR